MSKADSAFDTLARFVQLTGSDPAMQRQFSMWSRMASVQRRNEIYVTTEQMRARGEEADLVAVFGLLADDRVFDAVCLALRESGCMDS